MTVLGVEAWTFVLVHHDGDSILAYWVRTVNNLDLPVSNTDHHFAAVYSGMLRRASE